MTNQTETTQAHAELTASIFKSRGMIAQMTNKGNVRISLKYRGVSKQEVSDIIYDEELPIDDSQLVNTPKLVADVGRDLRTVKGVYSVNAVFIRL